MSRRVSLRIHYHRRSSPAALLTLILLLAAFLVYLAWSQREAAAFGPQAPHVSSRASPLAASANMREYYVTQTSYNGANANTACAGGYHFASLWEILDTSNLKYNTNRGVTQDDSGQGPPSYYAAWVRTGYSSSAANTAGQGNCNAWASSDGNHYGTPVYLSNDWTTGQDIHVWEAYTETCSSFISVWCVENIAHSGICANPLTIACGQQLNGDTSSYANNHDNWYDCSAWDESGPEAIYTFTLTAGSNYTVTATLSNLSADLDVFLLSDCDNEQCLVAGSSYGDNMATVSNIGPGTYYAVVDGYNGAAGSYTLSLACTAAGAPCTDLTSVTISGPMKGYTSVPYTFTADFVPLTATTPIAYTWVPKPDSGQGTASVRYTWATTGTKTINLAASNCSGAGTANDSHTITIAANQGVYLPLVLR